MVNDITIGVDLFQKQDPPALSILQCSETGEAVRDLVTYE